MVLPANDPKLLDQGTTYTWFLSKMEVRDIKNVRTLIFDWSCKEVEITIKEYLRLHIPLNSDHRVYMMMVLLGWKKSPSDTTGDDVVNFFERGMRIKTQPIRYWSSLNSETMEWKLNYDHLVLDITKPTDSMGDDEKHKLIDYAQRYSNYEEALAKIASNSPHKVEAYLQLYKDGEITFPKS